MNDPQTAGASVGSKSFTVISKRQQQILDYLGTRSMVTVNELVAATGASPATIRRDLVRLDDEGRIYRVRGSVSLKSSGSRQPTTSEKRTLHHEQKIRIAEEAVKLVHPGDSVLLDAGTTTIEIASRICEMPLKVITTDLNIGILLAPHRNIDLSLTGGTVDWSSQSCIGDLAREVLLRIHPTVTFISCNAWDLRMGITAPTIEKARLKADLLKQATKTVLVADSSKYGNSQLFEVGRLSQADLIITDSDLGGEDAEKVRNAGVSLKLV
ncbi:MAG: DeoR/GlpR family DNA-binding transcription regulator [Succinivibrio sp.]|jgi:DeoR/GlpR family transcriptional regulator of sugar metabolism|nr:DeoR/GlpR family DNA-binding transcription regulator [Succinivibrio sp.]